MILEFRGHGGEGGVEHFGISEGKRVNMVMLPAVGYGYFLESPIPLGDLAI